MGIKFKCTTWLNSAIEKLIAEILFESKCTVDTQCSWTIHFCRTEIFLIFASLFSFIFSID